MNKRVGQFFLLLILILSLSACNLQLVEGAESDGIILTITANAQILEQAALAGQTEPPAQEQIVIVVTATGEGGAAVEQVIPAPLLPPAVGDVTVTVSVATNCRTGPGTAFKSIYGMPVGQVAKVVAKNSYSGYWIIEIPGQNGQTCWLWGQYATISGDTASLKDVVTPTSAATLTPSATKAGTATASATPAATFTPTASQIVIKKPAAPSNFQANITCTALTDPNFFGATYTATWTDNSDNETAFRISIVALADGDHLFTDSKPANSTHYDSSEEYPGDLQLITVEQAAGNFVFSLVAVNMDGINNAESDNVQVTVQCQ